MIILMIFFLVSQVKGEGGCRDLKYLKCIENKTLTGHVISTIKMITPVIQLCQNKCFREHRCVSYNLGPVLGQIRRCELNAADHSTRPSFMVNKAGYEYCPIMNPCLSNPCPAGRLCTPNFDWNTYSCNDGGWTQWGPWSRECSQYLPLICTPTKTRSCTNPAPRNNGIGCHGLSLKTKHCQPNPKVDITGCTSALGMQDGTIKDNQINASSSYSIFHAPKNGRLHKKNVLGVGHGAWSAGRNINDEYIQIDLGMEKVITMVATQGRQDNYDQWLTKYALSYSNDGKNWKNYKEDCTKVFKGNSDRDTVVTHELEVPIKTRHIRLIVKGFNRYPSLRMELYGCTQFPV